MKPKMTEEITFDGDSVRFKLDADFERFSSGGMRFCFADTSAEIRRGEEQLGDVCGCVGGGTQVMINGRTWYLSPLEIWKAAQAADAAYMESVKPKRKKQKAS